MPVFIILLVIVIVFIRYETKKGSKQQKLSSEEFWRLENEASFTRKTDISGLNYIEYPKALIDSLPRLQDKEYSSSLEKLQTIEDAKILNLTGITNTELKKTYGAGNFTVLSECDAAYDTLYSSLRTMRDILLQNSEDDAAKKIDVYLKDISSDT